MEVFTIVINVKNYEYCTSDESMKDCTEWTSYSGLAWTEHMLAPPEEYAKETELLVEAVKENSKIEVKSLLHLGCGAGGNDFIFKKHYQVTGVDISEKMLEIAEDLNPEATYHHGDMRTMELGLLFDAVVVPESIDYMRTENDLYSAIMTAEKHLKPGGIFIVVANIVERFRQNNFVYSSSREDIEITLFENNYIPAHCKTTDGANHEATYEETYESTLVYLIRRKGILEIYTDRHILGLFKLKTWLRLLKRAGFNIINQLDMDHGYDQYIAGEGQYSRLMFVCEKKL